MFQLEMPTDLEIIIVVVGGLNLLSGQPLEHWLLRTVFRKDLSLLLESDADTVLRPPSSVSVKSLCKKTVCTG
jgi:hypothetical protein